MKRTLRLRWNGNDIAFDIYVSIMDDGDAVVTMSPHPGSEDVLDSEIIREQVVELITPMVERIADSGTAFHGLDCPH